MHYVKLSRTLVLTGIDMNNIFFDSIKSFYSNLTNKRNPLYGNTPSSRLLDNRTLNEIYKLGIGNKIARIKGHSPLKNSIEFSSKDDEEFFNRKLRNIVLDASMWMVAFGRSIIVVFHPSEKDLSQRLKSNLNKSEFQYRVFDRTEVSAISYEPDLLNERYDKPNIYSVGKYQFHYSRVVDFTYIRPIHDDLPTYDYGGIPEYELIYNQIITDGIVERSSAAILEKSSTFIYKVNELKNILTSKQQDVVLEYFRMVEEVRSIYGAVMLDKEDEPMVMQQQLSNLKEINDNSLRRLSMVTSIPIAVLVGENVQGMNANGEKEMDMMQETKENIQQSYLIEPLNKLMLISGRGPIKFKENQGDTPQKRIDLETKTIANAKVLNEIGEDYNKYLVEKGILEKKPIDDFFPGE